jgi:hypothetical protein
MNELEEAWAETCEYKEQIASLRTSLEASWSELRRSTLRMIEYKEQIDEAKCKKWHDDGTGGGYGPHV